MTFGSTLAHTLLFLVAFALILKFANGGDIDSCYDPESLGYCFFQPDGKDLQNAVRDYYRFGGVYSQAAEEYGTVIGNWRVDYDESYSSVFSTLLKFNEPLTNWNTSSAAVDMSYMFSYARSFNQPLNPDNSNVINMESMFSGAAAFNQPVHFDTSNVVSMNNMFGRATAFNQQVVFDTSKVTDMGKMFYNALTFIQPVNFNTAKVSTMDEMFSNAESFNQTFNFNTTNLTILGNLYGENVVEMDGTTSFTQACYKPVGYNTSDLRCCFGPDGRDLRAAVYNYNYKGKSASPAALKYGKSIGDWCVDYVQDFSYLFFYLQYFDEPLTNWNMSSALNMSHMFDNAESFNQPLNFDTSKVVDMSHMFDEATNSINH
jgi:hypothetical protein